MKYESLGFARIFGKNEGIIQIDFSGLADPRTNRYVLCSTEDNLIKGAGGQAIQAMNLCQGYPEESGLS